MINVYGVITSFEYQSSEPLPVRVNGKWYSTRDNCSTIIHIRKIGERNLVLYVEVKSGNNTAYIAKYKAKQIKNRWQLQPKIGAQCDFNAHYMNEKLTEAMADIILLG